MSGLEDGYALGLDLGTTFSCIGVFRNGGVEIIPNSNGEKVTPSIVTFLDEKNILKGEETEEYLVKNYESSIYAIKRFIGRNFKDKKQNLQEEIKSQNFPFNIVNQNNIPKVEIVKNNKKYYFSLEQISSFVIKKMVQSAEDYLNKRVKKLVITIPHNFSDDQRKSTIEAAKLAGVEVLRIINEPTAAALAYGLQEKNNLKNNKKILVFDLGGGTFDVTILNITKDEKNNQNFDVISTASNKFFGGEDFDNKLVEYVLDNFCDEIEDSPEKKEETKKKIKEQKKLIKRLKLSCENIKRVLSIEKDTTLCINNFYDNKDIVQNIDRNTFEKICDDLFKKIEAPIEDALNAKNIKDEEIGEIVLVGGSSRIPKIKSILKNQFKCKINDTINPDETIAYGATLMAAKLSIKKCNLTLGFNLMDITPLSLGVEVVNEDEDEEIRKEGGKMSVIIERGEKIPCTKIRNYVTVEDNQTSVPIVIYEGQKKYVKYNHELKKIELTGLTKKPKGKVHIKVKFFIDTNGILTVTGTEEEKDKDNSTEVKIKDDRIKFNDKEIEKLKKENESLYKKRKSDDKKIDYNNIKETLKEFQDAYKEKEEEGDEEEKFEILINYNNTLEEFINLFDKNFDNETMIEKFYIYVKELFISYQKTLNMKEQIDKEENKSIKDKIIKKIKEYIDEFIMKNSGYLNNLVETIKPIPKELFYEIITYIMKKYNECGKNCLKEMQKYCRYNSLIYFERSKLIFDTYIQKTTNLTICKNKEISKNCKLQLETSSLYIKDIHSGAILLGQDSLKQGKLISTGSGFTVNRKGLTFGLKDECEKNKIVLENYEKLYAECIKSNTRNIPQEEKERIKMQEAICIANIIKINVKLLGNINYKLYNDLAEKCQFIANDLNIDKNTEWYKEFLKIYDEIKEMNGQIQSINDIKDSIRLQHINEFTEIDNKFDRGRNKKGFIKYILETTPYDGYEDDKKNKIIDNKNENELIDYLKTKYHPNNYEFTDNPNRQLRYCKIEHIESLLNSLH